METKEIFSLIESLKTTEYAHIEINHEGTHLVFDKVGGAPQYSQQGPVAQPVYAPAVMATPVPEAVQAQKVDQVKTAVIPAIIEEQGSFEFIESPIVGTFYDASSPEANPYVKVGDRVKKGDVVCIIEAMKLMNEIESEVDGEVVEILTKNEGPVEYGQKLFKVKPL